MNKLNQFHVPSYEPAANFPECPSKARVPVALQPTERSDGWKQPDPTAADPDGEGETEDQTRAPSPETSGQTHTSRENEFSKTLTSHVHSTC